MSSLRCPLARSHRHQNRLNPILTLTPSWILIKASKVLNSNSPGVADPDEVASLVGCVRIRIQAQPCDLSDPTRSSGVARQASIWWHHVDTWQEKITNHVLREEKIYRTISFNSLVVSLYCIIVKLIFICVAFTLTLKLLSGEFPTQRPVTRSFDVFFDLRPNKRLSKHWWGWWFETPSWPL